LQFFGVGHETNETLALLAISDSHYSSSVFVLLNHIKKFYPNTRLAPPYSDFNFLWSSKGFSSGELRFAGIGIAVTTFDQGRHKKNCQLRMRRKAISSVLDFTEAISTACGVCIQPRSWTPQTQREEIETRPCSVPSFFSNPFKPELAEKSGVPNSQGQRTLYIVNDLREARSPRAL
jgi:hypothetical protein